MWWTSLTSGAARRRQSPPRPCAQATMSGSHSKGSEAGLAWLYLRQRATDRSSVLAVLITRLKDDAPDSGSDQSPGPCTRGKDHARCAATCVGSGPSRTRSFADRDRLSCSGFRGAGSATRSSCGSGIVRARTVASRPCAGRFGCCSRARQRRRGSHCGPTRLRMRAAGSPQISTVRCVLTVPSLAVPVAHYLGARLADVDA